MQSALSVRNTTVYSLMVDLGRRVMAGRLPTWRPNAQFHDTGSRTDARGTGDQPDHGENAAACELMPAVLATVRVRSCDLQ
jgi:hypothetical protein